MAQEPKKNNSATDAEAAAADVSLPEAGQTPQKKSISRSLLSRLTIAAFSGFLMLSLGFLGLFAMLSRGPLEVPFLQERLAQALEKRMGGQIDVEVGQAVIQKAALGMELHVKDIVLKDIRGRELIRAPDL
jgi:hypothetical protein